MQFPVAGRWICVAVFCFTLLSIPSLAQQGAGSTSSNVSPGTSVGQKIGNAVSAAVKTAFPAIQPVIDAIWGGNNKNKSKADAQAALETARPAALQKQQPAFDELQKAAADLATVRTFLSYCVAADEQIVTIRSTLARSVIGSTDKKTMTYAWNIAKSNLQQLGGDTVAKQVDAMGDPFVQLTLRNVTKANLGYIQNIETQLSKDDWESLRSSIGDLETKVSGVNALAGILIGDVSAGIASIPDKIKNVQGAPNDPEAEKQSTLFKERLNQLYSSQ